MALSKEAVRGTPEFGFGSRSTSVGRKIKVFDRSKGLEIPGVKSEAGFILDLEKPEERAEEWSQTPESLDAYTQNPVRAYLRELGKIPLLTAQQEIELAKRIENGDSKAKKKMIESNLRLSFAIAKHYHGDGMDLLDLTQWGNLGLHKAVEKFDWRLGYKFSTYATWWIRQRITRAIADYDRTIRIPVHLNEKINKGVSAKKTLLQTLGREPSIEEIAEEAGLEIEEMEKLIKIAVKPTSLSVLIGEDEDFELGNLIENPDDNTEELAFKGLRSETLHKVLKSLPERDRKTLELRFGLNGNDPHTLEETGKHFGVTRERVRQIETKALTRIRANDSKNPDIESLRELSKDI
ncbi:MAG: hypothetical protein A2152_03295 [Candidatus Levybacteria bacterium RBG_16_35_6]|nr:MAG: hypothetical protein A2152_03295 [Candidatus Levybacteria bacterium RBG_16_35_6]